MHVHVNMSHVGTTRTLALFTSHGRRCTAAKRAWLRSLLDCQVCALPCLHAHAMCMCMHMQRCMHEVHVLCFVLADGWAVLLANSEPREPFYHHDESNLTQWERPI